jgi:Fe-S-cluster containining protein
MGALGTLPVLSSQPTAGPCTERLLAALDLSVCNGCDLCGLRCTDGVPMTHAEYEAIVQYLGAQGIDAESVAPDADSNPDWGASCRFRDERRGRCRIYPVRPLICRLMGHVWWLPCPVEKVPQEVPVALVSAALEEYCHAERHPFGTWLETRDPAV